jgi:DNA polymerase III sliding clamp (beta) subunit (PCNA family)
MKINITASDLKSALAGFSKVVQKRTTLPVLGCILFQSKQGQLQLTATNLDEYVSAILPCNSVPEFKGLIPFETLHKIAKGCASVAGLEIEFAAKQARIRYPVATAVLTETVDCIPVDEFPAAPQPEWHEPVTVGEDFKNAIREALDSVSEDHSRYILNHAFVDVSNPEGHYIVGTSGRELYSANTFKFGFKESLIVPNRRFLLWKGFMEAGDWTITLGTESPKKKNEVPAGWIKVQAAEWTFITRQIDGQYPYWKSTIPSESPTSTVRFNEQAQEFIRLAAPRLPGAGDINAPVSLVSTEAGSLLLQARAKVHEASIPVTGATVEGQPFKKTLNRNLLLKAMHLGLNELEIHGDNIAMVFKNGGKRLVVARMRDDEDEKPPTPTPTQPQESAPTRIQSSAPETSSSPEQDKQPQEEQEEQQSEVKTINRIENVSTETGNTGNPNSSPAPASAFDQVRAQLEKLKDLHKCALADINESLKMLAVAQRERKATEKEIEEVRETLQSLQKIRI